MSGGGGGGGEFDVQLNLVPLVDILTNILFFLLIGFAAQEAAFNGENDITLPAAKSDAEMSQTVSISISKAELLVDQLRIAKISAGKIEAEIKGDQIVPLYEKLNMLRAARHAETGGVGKSDDVIFLVADKTVPFTVLSPVMKTAAMAGFPNFRFAVIKK
jgi:biopolymer transport protein ExbD